MIEKGGIYKLKGLDFGNGQINKKDQADYKVIGEDGKTVVCKNLETKELFLFNKNNLIDPDVPNDTTCKIEIVTEKLNAVMKPTDSIFWKEMQEEFGGGCVASVGALGGSSGGAAAPALTGGTTMGSLGGIPTPALAQLANPNISAATVNGMPVPSQSIMALAKKKIKKNKKKKKHESDNTKTNELFVSALNLLELGFTEEDYKEYQKLLSEIQEKELLQDYAEFAQKRGFEKDSLALEQFGRCAKNDLANVVWVVDEGFDEQEKIDLFARAGDWFCEYQTCKNQYDPLGMYGLEGYLEYLETIKSEGLLNEFIAYMKKQGISKSELELKLLEAVLNEDFNEEYESITEQISKYLDRLNFAYANTDDIVYKKEGDYKYLFKFDNEKGIIKIKVLEQGKPIVEKEYDINSTDDIQPIFDEIEDLYRKYGLTIKEEEV